VLLTDNAFVYGFKPNTVSGLKIKVLNLNRLMMAAYLNEL